MKLSSTILVAMTIGSISASAPGASTDRIARANTQPVTAAARANAGAALTPLSGRAARQVRRAAANDKVNNVAFSISRAADASTPDRTDANAAVRPQPGTFCAAEVNGDGTLNERDLFAYLDMYFAGDKRADLTGEGAVGVQDLLDYAARYIAGCGAKAVEETTRPRTPLNSAVGRAMMQHTDVNRR
jgi:hypothetical protein